MMRKRSAWIVVACATLALLGVAAGAAREVLARWPAVRELAWGTWAAPAAAQEVMQFEPIPAESAAAMERRRAATEAARAREAARRARQAIPRPADIPEPPEPPVVPKLSHAGDVVRIGSDITIDESQVIEGDVFALQGDIRVDGYVKGNVAATGGNVHLGPTARVDGDVMCIGGTLVEEPGARVGGQRVTALHGGRAERRAQHMRHRRFDPDWKPDGNLGHLSFAFSWLAVSLLLAWGIARFAPARTGVALETLKREPGLSLLLGLAIVALLIPSVVAMALVVVILCITIIGIPLALGVMMAYAGLLVVLALWGFVVGAAPIGERLARRVRQEAGGLGRAAVLGVLAVSGLRLASELFHFIPLFGWVANLLWVVAFLLGAVVTMMGAGSLLRSKFGQGVEGRWWPLLRPGTSGSAAPPGPPAAPATAAPPAPGGPSQPSPAA